MTEEHRQYVTFSLFLKKVTVLVQLKFLLTMLRVVSVNSKPLFCVLAMFLFIWKTDEALNVPLVAGTFCFQMTPVVLVM